MTITYGRRHGNGYHGNVYQRISVTPSKAFTQLLEYEISELEKNKTFIREKDFYPSWIERTCLNCFMEYMQKKGDIFICSKCGLKMIPKVVWSRNPSKSY